MRVEGPTLASTDMAGYCMPTSHTSHVSGARCARPLLNYKYVVRFDLVHLSFQTKQLLQLGVYLHVTYFVHFFPTELKANTITLFNFFFFF